MKGANATGIDPLESQQPSESSCQESSKALGTRLKEEVDGHHHEGALERFQNPQGGITRRRLNANFSVVSSRYPIRNGTQERG